MDETNIETNDRLSMPMLWIHNSIEDRLAMLAQTTDAYAGMKAFFIYGKALDFDTLIDRIEELQRRLVVSENSETNS